MKIYHWLEFSQGHQAHPPTDMTELLNLVTAQQSTLQAQQADIRQVRRARLLQTNSSYNFACSQQRFGFIGSLVDIYGYTNGTCIKSVRLQNPPLKFQTKHCKENSLERTSSKSDQFCPIVMTLTL